MRNKDFYDENGYLVINDAISAFDLENFNKKYLNKYPNSSNKFNVLESPYVYAEIPELMEILCNSFIFEIFDELEMEVALHASSATVVSTEVGCTKTVKSDLVLLEIITLAYGLRLKTYNQSLVLFS